VADDWSWLDAVVGELDEDVAQAVSEPSPQQEHPELDDLFR
jgi:hypothetical protein